MFVAHQSFQPDHLSEAVDGFRKQGVVPNHEYNAPDARRRSVKAAVDVMGGDHAPHAILQGCWDAASLLDPTDQILLVGDKAVIEPALAAASLTAEQRALYQVVHTTQVIAMDDSPVEAVRGKPDSSIAVMCKLAAAGQADAVISAGNTGACVAAAQLRMRTIPGVARPGIAVAMPSIHGPVIVCDMGANVAPKKSHFVQYAIMASAYAESMGRENPRVGLLSIGEEDSKGTALVKGLNQILKDEPQINFIGNVEGKDVFRGVCDVVVTDGFTGNVLLKAAEGMAEGLMASIKKELSALEPSQQQAFGAVLKKAYGRFDWQEAGGAPLLGVGGICLIAHGRSDARAIRSAIRAAKTLVGKNINGNISQRIGKANAVSDD